MIRDSAHAEAIDTVLRFDPFLEACCRTVDVRQLGELLGVTRFASTIQLDRVGVPTCYAIRPAARHPACVYSSGKAFSWSVAELGALFEAYERWAAEQAAFVIEATMEEISEYSSQALLLPFIAPTDQWGTRIKWALGKHLTKDLVVAVPAEYVEFPPKYSNSMAIRTTTGLAAHLSYAQAVSGGYLECLERHDAANLSASALYRIPASVYSPETIALLDKFSRERIECHIFAMNLSPTDHTSVYCFTADHWLEFPQLYCSGFASAFSLREAVDRAILEAMQSRVSFITGVRSDVKNRIVPRSYDTNKVLAQREWLDSLRSVCRSISEEQCIATMSTPSQGQTLREKVFHSSGGANAAAFQLRTLLGIPAVRVFVPELDDCY